ncbi:unnamed protein product [Eruca vesicaria subsp. sativa]|uniref:Tyrosine decarboxylase n=1 Tax=Eruca vesicaria subsp. sativa TaxID=29727 RepID=A0ABC8IRJ0_ERUVS|nr:unnamed protein product [Eruca vesicaria subsp. sativa]
MRVCVSLICSMLCTTRIVRVRLEKLSYFLNKFEALWFMHNLDILLFSLIQPGYLHNLLPDSAPDHPDTLEQVLEDVKTKILPGVTHWQSPSFFAFYPSNSSVAGFLGDILSTGLGIVGFSWITSPAATELEIIVLDWLAKLLNLPEQFLSEGNGGGVIQGSASESVHVAMTAARDKVLRRVGKNALGKLVVYSSDQTHSSLQKACQIAGIHPENCRVLKADSSTNYTLRPELLQEAVSRDLEAGLIPFFLGANVGTTSSGAVDPLASLGKIANRNEMWFHVDAAYAGSACICPEYRQYIDGVETADSFNMNAHKWLLTNFDCSLLWVKDQSTLTEAFSTNPEYLQNKASQANLVVDYKDWQIALSRRFRSLKLWMVLRLYGAETLKNYIRNHIKLATVFEQLVSQDPNFEVITPRIFSLVCFRMVPVDNDEKKCNDRNRELLEAVNSSGKLFIIHTVSTNNSLSLSFFCSSFILVGNVLIYIYRFASETGSLGENLFTFFHRSAIDRGEAHKRGMEGYPGGGIKLASQVNTMKKYDIMNKNKISLPIWFGFVVVNYV